MKSDADNDARSRHRNDALFMGFGDEGFQHALGDVEFGNHAISQRPDRHDVRGCASHHLLGFGSNRKRPLAFLLDRHPRWFIDNNTLPAHMDQCVGRAQVDADIEGE